MDAEQKARRVLAVDVWLTIDATMDDVARDAIESNDDVLSVRAQSLRKHGWAVGDLHPQTGLGPAGWPPRTARLEIELSADDLVFIREHLVQASVIIQRILGASQLSPQVHHDQGQSLLAVSGGVGRRRHPCGRLAERWRRSYSRVSVSVPSQSS